MSKVTNNQNIQSWTDATDYVLSKFDENGDFYRKHVLNPALFSLLGNVKGKLVLDAGSGEGYLSRLLAKQGAIVTAVEPAEGLITYAIERELKDRFGIDYIKADLSLWKDKQHYFDAVVSNMVFMDIPDYQSAMNNSIAALKSKGVLVFSISHPCFDMKGKWEEDKPYVQVNDYFAEYTIKNYIGVSIHRTLSSYINLVIEAGCNVVKILEPQVPEQVVQTERDKNIPNFLLVKAVKL